MQSFKAASTNPELYSHSSFYFRGDDTNRNQTRFTDLGELEQSATVFPHDDAVDLIPSSMFSLKANNVAVVPNNLHYGALNTSTGCLDIGSTITGTGGGCVETGHHQYMYHQQKGTTSSGNGHFENWGDSAMADNSQQTDDTSTDVDTDDKNQLHGVPHGALTVVDSMEQPRERSGDQKTLRRLAQNREAARKSRLRKKAYVQQLENSRLRLSQLEQELQRARQQGMFIATGLSGDNGHSMAGNGALAFDLEYARWLDEHQRLIHDMRSAVNSHMGDNELRILVDSVMTHYDEIFRLKSIAAKTDVFHMLSGMWKTPAERCFMWLGGFRSSELLKILGNQLEPLTDQQLMGICNLQQSSQQAEDALSQGMEALQQSLVDTLSSGTHGLAGSGNVADYMGQMAIAMGKLATLENFLHQADLLRQQTLQQMHRILTTRQAARALLVISDYFSRLRALSSLWLARPRD
ncbi:transcription factor HBP-1b(c38)-like [Prunus avium]|uniref:Transcription factor HBP-1b(C38)-like n=1 Tax=Prunus avium TaxID=42229 RepID=A0A6P5SBR8_PRUAV|nr:transcription factor HBP-1b(c38)-like [Prunus avium]XP_021814336.1 transcription factor HBP-1b(c38)-like [Prunus avium]